MKKASAWGRGGVVAAVAFPLLLCGAAPDAFAQATDDVPARQKGNSATPTAGDTVSLAPVMVTATKRKLDSFDVVGNISVVTAAQLKAAVVTKTEDLESLIPELSSMNRSARIYNNMTIRGQSSADYFSPSVGLYVDGVPQLSQSYAQSLLGIDRVELLKGPQGAIYGRGTMGGVLSLETRKPDDQPEIWGGFDYYGRGERVKQGASTGFGESGWAAQAVAMYERYMGYLDNPETGRDDVDTSNNVGGWASLHYRSPAHPFEMRLRVGGERYRSHEEYFVPFSPLSNKVAWSEIGAVVKPSLKRVSNDITWDGTYEVSSALTLKAITAYQSVDIDRLFLDGTLSDDSQNLFYTEVRANYVAGNLNFVTGAVFQKIKYEHENPLIGEIGMGGKMSNNDIYNYSVFFDGAWEFNPYFELSAGARLSLEDARSRMIILENGIDNFYRGKDTFQSFSPRAALAWLPNDFNRVWVGVGRGFKPGGFNKEGASSIDIASYDSEVATNYEIGWKWHSRNFRHSAEVTGYLIRSQDVQGYVGIVGAQYLSNMGDARSTGIEAAWKSELIDRHVFSVGMMFNNAHFTAGQYDGNRVAYAPRRSIIVAWDGRYLADDRLKSRVSLRQNGPFYFNESNSLRQKDYTILDASLMWDTRRGMEAGIYARNLLDRKYRTVAFEGVGAQLGMPREVGLQAAWHW